MDVGDERVALVDEHGHVVGAAPRREVRRRNLRHMATGVIVRNRLGLVYVHLRTPTKDVFAGMHDCCAGGVVGAGETPEQAAYRELAEELGVTGVTLVPVLVDAYADDVTRYVAYVYEALWDGPMRHQPEEVAWGGWMTLEELAERLADPGWPFVPDSGALVTRWLADRLAAREEVPGGWDSVATLVEGRWVDRVPRRPEVAATLRTETRLLPWLGPQLPIPVPQPVVVCEDPLRVRHPMLPGLAGGPYDRGLGRSLGRFLRALHAVPVAAAVARGVPGAAAAAAQRDEQLRRFAAEVVPMLPAGVRVRARRLLDAVGRAPHDSLVHADLGPEHLLVSEGRLSGVIDWSDSYVGDPALDLSWVLHGAPAEFAAGVAGAYGVDAELRERSLQWHRLGPWHEVTYGWDTDQPAYVESGLSGVLARL